MLLNALTNYLQNQPPPLAQAPVAADVDPKSEQTQALDDSGYAPSSRALMVSAVAHEFDVNHLTTDDVVKLQQRLQHFGLLQGRVGEAFSLLYAKQDEQPVDAVAVFKGAAERFDAEQVGYAKRQSITQMHTLMSNLASARAS